MTNEEFQKKKEFIIERQAQFVVNQELADERMTRTKNVVGRLATASLEKIEETEEKMSALIGSHIRLAESQARTDGSLKALAQSQAQTDERLNIFINVTSSLTSSNVTSAKTQTGTLRIKVNNSSSAVHRLSLPLI